MTQELLNPSGGLALVGFFLSFERVLVTRGRYEGWMTGPQQAGGFSPRMFHVDIGPCCDIGCLAWLPYRALWLASSDDCTGRVIVALGGGTVGGVLQRSAQLLTWMFALFQTQVAVSSSFGPGEAQ